jgi:hypothetical protein
MHDRHMPWRQPLNSTSFFRAGSSAHTSHWSFQGVVLVVIVLGRFLPTLIRETDGRAEDRRKGGGNGGGVEGSGDGDTGSDGDRDVDISAAGMSCCFISG